MPLPQKPIFDGAILPAERNTIARYLKENKFKRILIPCAGKFAIAEALVSSGIPPDKIVCSDISLTSTMVGYYLSGQHIATLNIKADFDFIDPQAAPQEYIASVIYAILLTKAKEMSFYDIEYKRALEIDQDKSIQKIKENLEQLYGNLNGIEYQIKDIRDLVQQYKDDKDTFIIVDPPQALVETTTQIEDRISWSAPLAPPFDAKEDLANLFMDLEDSKATAIILKQKDKQGVTAKWHPYHITVDNHINKRYLFLNRIVKESTIDRPKIGFTQPLDIPIIDRDHKITKDSKITVTEVNREVAWYYRDIFTYKFGAGSAEYNYLIMIDGKIASIRGYAPIGLSKDGTMLEIYGIVYNNTKYRHLGRLITRLITSHEFIDVINTSLFPVLTLKTTKVKFFKEDRELKGLDYEVYESTEVKDAPGKFKIKYQVKIKDVPYKDMIIDWLQEEANYGKPQKSKKRKPRPTNRPKK